MNVESVHKIMTHRAFHVPSRPDPFHSVDYTIAELNGIPQAYRSNSVRGQAYLDSIATELSMKGYSIDTGISPSAKNRIAQNDLKVLTDRTFRAARDASFRAGCERSKLARERLCESDNLPPAELEELRRSRMNRLYALHYEDLHERREKGAEFMRLMGMDDNSRMEDDVYVKTATRIKPRNVNPTERVILPQNQVPISDEEHAAIYKRRMKGL